MNFLRHSFTVVTCLLIASICHAQPPEPVNPNHRYVQQPEDAIRWLVSAFNGKGSVGFLAQRVVGANPKTDGAVLDEVGEELQKARGTFLLSVNDFQTKIDGNKAAITFQATLQDRLLNEISQTENLQLRKVESKWETFWEVVPGHPEEVATNKNAGILLRLATYMAHPQKMLNISRTATSKENMHQLAIGLYMLLQDYDEKFAITVDDFQEKLAPYVQSGQQFYAPADKSGTVSYSLNPKLSGLHTHRVDDETVMIYEGKNGQLDFRYEGRAIVVLKNGIVKLLTPEEAKTLRWTP